MGDLELVYLLTVTSKFTLPELVTQICDDFVETGRFLFVSLLGFVLFFYGDSPRTPPLEGTSLHE